MWAEPSGQGRRSGAAVALFSAAAGASRGLGLSVEQTIRTLGITGTHSAGLMATQCGAMVKRMHAGRPWQSGLYRALPSEFGFTGMRTVFESEYGGFRTSFSRSPN